MWQKEEERKKERRIPVKYNSADRYTYKLVLKIARISDEQVKLLIAAELHDS